MADGISDTVKTVETTTDAAKSTDTLKTVLDASDDPMTEMTKLSDGIALKSPVKIPEGATKKIEVKKNGYYQIKYEWPGDDGFNYTSRWHTRPPNSPAEQMDTFVVERTAPGIGYGKNPRKRVEQVLVGENKWVLKDDWKAARRANGRKTITREQEEMLYNGHWKA